MRSRRDLVVLATLLLTLVLLGILLRPYATERADVFHLSTYRLGPNGARALYLLAEELGFPTARDLDPWTRDAPEGGIVLLAPLERPSGREIDEIEAWLSDGGVLIYGAVPVGPDVLAMELGLQTRPLTPDTMGRFAALRWEGTEAIAGSHPLGIGLAPVPGFRYAFSDTSRAIRTGTAEVVLRTADGSPAVVDLPIGTGRAIVWSDPTVLGNRALRHGSAATLFARAADAAVGANGVLRFDEYHQGYREGGGLAAALRLFLLETGPGRALVQVGVATLLLLLLSATRFGQPREERGHWRRSPLEHVEAMAAAYRRAKARRTAKRLLLSGLERRIGRRIGPEQLARTRSALPEGAAARLRAELETDDTDDLVALAAAIDEFEMEAHRWK